MMKIAEEKVNEKGAVLAIQPISNWIYFIISLLLLAVLILMAATLHYSDRKVVKGYLVPAEGIVRVYSSSAGVIDHIYIRNGSHVLAGNRLVEISDKNSTLKDGSNLNETLLNESENERTEKAQQLSRVDNIVILDEEEYKQKKVFLNESINKLLVKRKYIGDIVLLKAELVKNAEGTESKKAISKFEAIKIKQEYLEQQEKLVNLDIELGKLRQERITLDSAKSKSDIKLKDLRSGLNMDLSSLKKESARTKANSNLLLTASQAGTISNLLVHEGAYVGINTLLMTLIPAESNLEVELLASSDTIGAIKLGLKVLIKFDSYPHELYGFIRGKVSHIDNQILTPDELSLSPIKPGTSVYKVIVEIDKNYITAKKKNPISLKSGMTLSADVLLEERSLLSWVFSPLIYSSDE